MRPKAFLLPLLTATALGIAAALLLKPSAPVVLQSGTALQEPRPIREFELVDQQGHRLTREVFRGRWSLVYAGFTNCPDICPTTLALLAELKARLRARGIDPQIVFLSVDPERDTPAQLAQYVGHFDPTLIGVTGNKAQIDRLCADLGLAYVINPGVGSEYTVDHPASLILIDQQARFAAYFRPPFALDGLAADLEGLAGSRN